MELKILGPAFSVCKVARLTDIDLTRELFFIGRTDEEISLVCPTAEAPERTLAREDGWKGFRISGTLDFSLVGILSRISGLMAENGIGVFAVSTYNTDYIFVKKEKFSLALDVLAKNGYNIIQSNVRSTR